MELDCLCFEISCTTVLSIYSGQKLFSLLNPNYNNEIENIEGGAARVERYSSTTFLL